MIDSWYFSSISGQSTMFSRPGRDESEEDLLKFQREFLACGSSPSASVSRVVSAQNPSSSLELCQPTPAVCSSEDVSREKRPHGRDVVHLQGFCYVMLLSHYCFIKTSSEYFSIVLYICKKSSDQQAVPSICSLL